MVEQLSDGPWALQSDLARRIQDELGQNVYRCYQCGKCTSGCPVAEFFDWPPNAIMRAVQLGQEDIALRAQTPWLCSSCQTCTTRCPQELDIAAIMDFLTRESRARGIKPAVQTVDVFNEAFLREVRLWGRAYELGLMAEMKLRTGNWTNDLDLGITMLRKRKLNLLPRRGRPPRRIRSEAPDANTLGYYPGCSLHSSAREFDESARAVAGALDMALVELPGWVCCGSSAAHRADPQTARRLPLQNLSIAEQSGFSEVVMPCAACFNRHKAAQFEIRRHPDLKAATDEQLGYTYQDSIHVSTLIDAMVRHAGVDRVAERVTHPLTGLRAVCYYGCLLTRPPEVTEASHPENPDNMDRLVAALGVEVRDWSHKTACCGAAHSVTRPDIVLSLSRAIIERATEAGADIIVVACPLCHLNLDARQSQMNLEHPVPVLYFTQLMSLAFGLPEKAALDKNLVDPRPILERQGAYHRYR